MKPILFALLLLAGVTAFAQPETVRCALTGQWPGYPRGDSWDVAVQGNYAFVAAKEGGLMILDITDPANPVRVASCPIGVALGVAVAGNYAYVTGFALHVIDVSDPHRPILKGTCVTQGQTLGVSMSGNRAYVAGYAAGLQVVDVSDPVNPRLVDSRDTPGLACNVAVAGSYAYIADEGGGLQIFPLWGGRQNGSYSTRGPALDVAVSGNYAYVAEGDGGLEVVDVSNFLSPSRAGAYDASGVMGVVVNGIRPIGSLCGGQQ